MSAVPRLRAGDTVAVIAPAGPVPAGLLDEGLAVLRSWGLSVRVGEHVRDDHPTFDYLAGADADRAADLQRAWCDQDVRAVFCARGGYGCLRMVDLIDWDAMRAAGPKLLVGSSDVTVLHQAVGARIGCPSVFAPMIGTESFLRQPPAIEHLRRALFEPPSSTTGPTESITGKHAEPLISGVAQGITVGGNLSLLAAGIGSAVDWRPRPAIALLEDVDEKPYRIDSYLTQLLRAGWFDGVTGIALGSWVDCGPADEVRAVCVDRLTPLGIPVLWELGFGHCRNAFTVELGVDATLDTTAGTLTLRG